MEIAHIPPSTGGGPKTIGAYMLRHVKSGLTFIGSTKDLYNRRASHLSTLRNLVHKNARLQEAYKQHPVFEFYSHATKTLEEAEALERKLIADFELPELLINVNHRNIDFQLARLATLPRPAIAIRQD